MIATFFVFLGYIYLTRAWPRLETLLGLFLVLVGVLIAMKVNVKPFDDLMPKAMLAAYFSREGDDASSRRRRLQRISVVLLAIPLLFFTPVVLVVGDVDKMRGYMAVSFFVFLLSIFFAIAGGLLAVRNWFTRNRN